MHRHVPSPLRGPLTRSRSWWTALDAPPARRGGRGKTAAVRHDLVARVRREIADGRYDTPEKWDAALQRLFARLERG
jgi:hypothetical protein